MQLFSFSSRSAKVSGFSALAALFMGLASAHGQATYVTSFDNLNPNNTLSDQDGWTNTDPNQPDSVGILAGYSTSGTDFVASEGGLFLASGGGPTVSPGYLSHGFAPVGNYSFNVDYAITGSATPFLSNNRFSFTFSNTALSTPLNAHGDIFSIDFVPQTATATPGTNGVDAVRYTVYNAATGMATQTTTGLGFSMNQLMHLSLSVNTTANTLSFSVTGPIGAPITVADAPLTGTLGALVTSLSAEYIQAPGAAAGSNALIFNNLAAVPEPSTYAMVGLGVLGLAARFRRKARA